MALDNRQRAVLTIAALARLVETKRRLAPDDASGLVIVEFLERLVTNGSVSARDEILESYEKHESFERFLAQKAST